MTAVVSAIVYFAVTYAAGFVFGTLRELMFVPYLGKPLATLIETPVMITVSVLSASWAVGRLPVPVTARQRATVGGVAFAILMLAEILSARLLFGQNFGQWIGHFTSADGAISLGAFGIFAVLPLFVRRA